MKIEHNFLNFITEYYTWHLIESPIKSFNPIYFPFFTYSTLALMIFQAAGMIIFILTHSSYETRFSSPVMIWLSNDSCQAVITMNHRQNITGISIYLTINVKIIFCPLLIFSIAFKHSCLTPQDGFRECCVVYRDYQIVAKIMAVLLGLL